MTMSATVKEYFAALERLKQNKPQVIEKGSPINKDTVALEAGRKRGSIRNRPGFEPLLEARGVDFAQHGRRRRFLGFEGPLARGCALGLPVRLPACFSFFGAATELFRGFCWACVPRHYPYTRGS